MHADRKGERTRARNRHTHDYRDYSTPFNSDNNATPPGVDPSRRSPHRNMEGLQQPSHRTDREDLDIHGKRLMDYDKYEREIPEKKIVLGTWRKEYTGSYQILPRGGAPDTFTYDKENDRFSDSYFRETYSRITGLEDAEREPTMNVTLHSARRVSAIGGSHPYSGNIYLVVNISVKNLNETGWYMFSNENIWVVPDGGTGSASINHKSGYVIENLFPASKILVGEEQQGAVIFGVPEQSQSFTLKLFNGMGETISNVVELDNVPLSDEYWSDPA